MWIFAVISAVLLLLLVGCWARMEQQRKISRGIRQDALILEESRQKLREFALEQIIQGNVPSFELLEDYYRIYDLSFDSDAFMLLTAKIRRHPYGNDSESQMVAYAAVKEELSGILGLYAQLNFVEADGILVCFFCEPRVRMQPPSGNHEALRQLVSQQCQACAASLMDHHQIDVIMAIGQYDMGGFALHSNYLTTKTLLEQAMCSRWSGNVVTSSDELGRKTDQEFANAQRLFYNCFVCFQYEDAAEHLFRMVQLRISDYYDSFPEAREVVANQLRFCTNMLELPLNVRLSLPEGEYIDIRELMASPDQEALHKNLQRYFVGLGIHTTGSSVQAAPTTERVRRYIQGNFTDPNISVSSISEKFHLNVSYISRQFKQEYGIGVLEYIHKLRIAKAKELMDQGLSPNDIFPQVGYTSRRAMDTVFSRYEGITPRTYQSQMSAEA